MAIIKMSKMQLIGLTACKDAILNAAHKAGCLEISATKEMADTLAVQNFDGKDALIEKHERVKRSIEFILERADKAKRQPYYPEEFLSVEPFVQYDEFMSAFEKEENVTAIVEQTEKYESELLQNKTATLKINNLVLQLTPYAHVKEPFAFFSDTKTTTVFFGTVKSDAISLIQKFKEENALAEFEVLSKGQQAVIALVVDNGLKAAAEQKLGEVGFSKCPFNDEQTAMQKIESALKEAESLRLRDQKITEEVCGLAKNLKEMRVFADYCKFLIEKATAGENFRCTSKTFILEGYVPEDRTEELKGVIEKVSTAVFIGFSEPTEDDQPPILLRNANPVKQSEFITDMYSPPNYKEIDPNKVVFFFFMLFMGVIMADIGYGLLMIGLGLMLASRIKVDNGTRRLWNIIAISGVSTVIFGALFNSTFGFVLPYTAPLPNPVPKGGEMDGLMVILLLCLGLGVVHIATGYFLKALNNFKQKDVAGGIFDGLIWVIFFIGLVFATFNFLIGYLMSDGFTMNAGLEQFFDVMCVPGIIMSVGAVVVAMLTAGRKEKGFGKFSKGFGAVYGIINIMSDILSYARLFGLMLSGMIISATFNDMGLGIISGGGLGFVFGGLVIVVGHVFNIAMGVLGAYIHNSRLQYIEFFGKFYEGEGNKFTPLGSKLDYVYLTK